jgi:ectoine hydroxylase-related dioxygenase (phytanoyl-CoA dioxygenase family)
MNIQATPIRQWDQTARAWFDEPDALERIARRGLPAQDEALLRKWVTDGYFVVDQIVPAEDIEAFLAEVKDIWERDTPIENCVINRVTMDGTFHPSVPHATLAALPREKRMQVRRDSNYTLGDIHTSSKAVARMFHNPRVVALSSLIFDGPAVPTYTLYFDKGSQQQIHQDAAVFHVFPPNNFIGVWIALEDISPDCGPLVYYPGSHKEPMWSEFPNYPQTNLRTGPPELFAKCDAYLAEIAKRHERKQALLKKGQALFWHGMLLHGGDKVNNPALTRQSLVIHVMKEGADVRDQIVGPFNW